MTRDQIIKAIDEHCDENPQNAFLIAAAAIAAVGAAHQGSFVGLKTALEDALPEDQLDELAAIFD